MEPGGGVVFLETVHTEKRNGNKNFFLSVRCLIFLSFIPSGSRQRGCAYRVCVFTFFYFILHLFRFFCPHSLFLFPSLISNPNVAGGGYYADCAHLSATILLFGNAASIHHVLSLAASVAPCWLSLLPGGSGGERGRRSRGAPRPPLAGSAAFLPFSPEPRCWQPPALLAAAPNAADGNSKPGALPASTGFLGNMLTLKSHTVVILILEKHCGTNCQYNEITDCVTVQTNTDIQS